MANKKPNWTSWVLKFVGGLAYLDVVWALWQGATSTSTVLSFLGPLVFGLATAVSIGYFLGTLASLAMSGASDPKMAMWQTKLGFYGGIALLALVGGTASGSLGLIALVGFVLAYVAGGMDRM